MNVTECRHSFREVRIGNDLSVRWTILNNGEARTLEGRDLTLVLWHASGSRMLTDFTVNDNVLQWTFPGKDQRRTGEYILTLIENKGLPGMATIDTKGFRLIGRMFDTNGLTEPKEVELQTGDMGIGAGLYGLATEDMDGLMSKEDKRLLGEMNTLLTDKTDNDEVDTMPEIIEALATLMDEAPQPMTNIEIENIINNSMDL